MKEAILRELGRLWQEHRGATAGTAAGVMLAVCILVFGFWPTLFVVFLGMAGLWLGREYDNGADALFDLRETLAYFLPERFQRHGSRNERDKFF